MASSASENILDAADRLFGEVGFDATTTREIAQACGVNKALIHYHYSTKDDLLTAVLDRYYDKLTRSLYGGLEGEGSPRDRLLVTLDGYVDFLAQNPGFSRIVQREASGGKHLERIVQRTVPIFQLGVMWVEREFPRAASDDLAAVDLLMSFYGMVVTYFSYSPVLEKLTGVSPLSEENLDRRKRHLHRMLDMILETLNTDGPPA
jgi:AcrR family transcriptional regulator